MISQMVNVLVPPRIKGSVILDSLLALTLFGMLLSWLIIFNLNNQSAKNAKLLATQTETFAHVFAHYLYKNLSFVKTQTVDGNSLTLTSQMLGDYWPADLADTNMYGQIPCVTIIKNTNTENLEALLYYVGSKTEHNSYQQTLLVNNTALLLGGKGGVLFDDAVQGNSGWSVSQGSMFFAGANQCGGQLVSPSVAINLDMLVDWNQTIQPNISITKAMDFGESSNQKTLPGHMVNTNTSKANINFASNRGVVFDNSNLENPLVLQMMYGTGTNEATLGFSGSNVTTLVADTIHPGQLGRAGDGCLSQEIGKTIADQGQQGTGLYQYLARNTLVCTRNSMLCASVNASNTCYLPSIANNIIFQNNNSGIQDTYGQFICPTAIPFASSITTSLGGSAAAEQILALLAGYTVTIGYRLTTVGVIITQVTCSNMPIYQEN